MGGGWQDRIGWFFVLGECIYSLFSIILVLWTCHSLRLCMRVIYAELQHNSAVRRTGGPRRQQPVAALDPDKLFVLNTVTASRFRSGSVR